MYCHQAASSWNTAIDRCDTDVEGSCDVADRLPCFNEMSRQGALVGPQYGRAAEGNAACLGGTPSFLGSGESNRGGSDAMKEDWPRRHSEAAR